MIVDLNQPPETRMPIGMHLNTATGTDSFYWTGKVAIGIQCPTYHPHFSPLPQSERQVLAAALKEGK